MGTRSTLAWVGLWMLVVTGCLSSTEGPSNSLVGDWFICMDEACATIDDDGLRFLADGVAYQLEGDDQEVTGEPICVVLDSGPGTYEWDGEILTVTLAEETQTLPVAIEGDRMWVSMGRGPDTVVLRRMETFDDPECPEYNDAPGVPEP